MPADKRIVVPSATFTIEQFCFEHNVSRAYFYLMQKEGTGPKLMHCGRRILISAESARRWRKAMEK